jgi:preprotein translocase subunit SecA
MPSPTEFQQSVRIAAPRREPDGFDAFVYGWWGKLRRGPWCLWSLKRDAHACDAFREPMADWTDARLDEAIAVARSERRAHPAEPRRGIIHGLALIAEAARRETGLRPYPVQLLAALALIDGYLAEIDTGEGKTLSIALAAAWMGWTGRPVHVITANDYLAGRDARTLGRFYQRLGIRVGTVLGPDPEADRHRAYRCDVTYTTAKETAADFLRDQIRLGGSPVSGPRHFLRQSTGSGPRLGTVLNGLHFVLIDEADNSLIDEATTPLIISQSGGDHGLAGACRSIWEFAARLKEDEDFEVLPAQRRIRISPPTLARLEDLEGWPEDPLWSGQRRRRELLQTALEARAFYRRDHQYVVGDGKIVIVDEATGRPMAQRTWQQGIHQMLEAKEGLAISAPNRTMARISFQEFFRRYEHLAGASGTLAEVAGEIWTTYGVPIIRIGRHLPCQRVNAGRQFFPDRAAKEAAILREIRVRTARGQPVLVGTRSVEASERIARDLRESGKEAAVLNARQTADEATIVAMAGQAHRVTIATNMAGRGTDIHLGPGVAILGGLHVIATEPHPSGRVDRQLQGRAARQGDPGSCLSLFALDDEIFTRHLPESFPRLAARCLASKGFEWIGDPLAAFCLVLAQWRSERRDRRARRLVIRHEAKLRGDLGFATGRAASRGLGHSGPLL